MQQQQQASQVLWRPPPSQMPAVAPGGGGGPMMMMMAGDGGSDEWLPHLTAPVVAPAQQQPQQPQQPFAPDHYARLTSPSPQAVVQQSVSPSASPPPVRDVWTNARS
jgi:hypothetical protein